MLKITVVGNRHGKAVIHWPGLLISFVLFTAVSLAAVALFDAILGNGFTLRSIALSSIDLPLIVLAFGVYRGLHTPPVLLTPLA